MQTTELDFVDPDARPALKVPGDMLVSDSGRAFSIIDDVSRFGARANYPHNFGFQRNLLDKALPASFDYSNAVVANRRTYREFEGAVHAHKPIYAEVD